MPVLEKTNSIQKLESFVRERGGPPTDWYVGISHDAAGRLGQHGMQDNGYAEWMEFPDEATARSAKDYLLQTGMQAAKARGLAEKPATQVYVYRAPKLTSFRELLHQKGQEGDREKHRKERREEWIGAVRRLITQLCDWLQEADSDGILDIFSTEVEKLEQELGSYEVPRLVVRLGDANLQIVPVARNVVGSVEPRGAAALRAEGRVDVTDGVRKYILYRTLQDGKERWYALDENFDPAALDQDRFMSIMEDLLT